MIPFLSEKAEAIYTFLLRHEAALRDLSEGLKQPRSSVLLQLQSLERKGLIKRVRIGKRNIWKAADPKILLKLAQEQVSAMRVALPELIAQKESGINPDQTLPDIRMYRGQQGINVIYESILELRKGERVLTFEGTKSVESKLRKLPISYMAKWQIAFKKRGLILESVVSEKSIKMLASSNKRLVESHLARPVIAYTVPDSFIESTLDIILYGRSVAYIDTERDLAVVIVDERIKKALESIFALMFASGKRVDLNRVLAGE